MTDAARSPRAVPRDAGHAPLAIVVHTTLGGWHGARTWLTDPASGVSAHWLVGRDGRIAALVDERCVARHAGVVVEPTAELLGGPDPNQWTIGIELVDDGDPDAPRPAAQLHALRRLLREIAARWDIPLDRRHVLAHRELRADSRCPGASLDLDGVVASAVAPRRVAAALPVRNGAPHLDGWLAAVRPLADVVLALDDGSSDATPKLLAAAGSFVEVIGRNPARETSAGWDDLGNRQRLVDAAAERGIDWLVFLDADERLHEQDAADLREFLLGGDALDSCAYALRHHRLWGDGHDPEAQLVYRIFSPRPGDQLPIDRLHRVPVPGRIPPGARLPTSVPLLHAGAIDDAGVRAHRRKYAEADPEGRWPVGYGGLGDRPSALLPGLPGRAPGTPILARPGTLVEPPAAASGRPLLAVLTPVRNAADHLDAWLAAAIEHADVVAVLDDGSTDNTADIVATDPRIDLRLANPTRTTVAGWNDAANRQQLLDALEETAPRWVLFLDVDERLHPADWTALVDALERGELDPGAVHQLRVCRMIGDLEHYDRDGLWVDRLFAWEPGIELPTGRLHAPSAPLALPRAATTLRIQHLSSLTAADRRARFEKYREADAGHAFQADYEALLDDPVDVRRFDPRPEGLPVAAVDGGVGVGALDPHALDLDAPVLSAIVIARDDEDRIEAAVRAVVEQEVDRPFEVIVVISGSDRSAQLVRAAFPEVRLVDLGPGEALPGRARNAGLALARGDYVSFPGSHVLLPPGSLQARLDAHEAGHAMVTGSFRTANRTRAGWAAHLLDHAPSLASRPSGPLPGPPGSCSYARDLLLGIGGFPEDLRAGEDTAVNVRLFEDGHRAWRSQQIVLEYRARATTARGLAAQHARRGRALGQLCRRRAPDERLMRGGLLSRRRLRPLGLWIVGVIGVARASRPPGQRTRHIGRQVQAWGDAETHAAWQRARWHVRLGATAAWVAAWAEILRPGR